MRGKGLNYGVCSEHREEGGCKILRGKNQLNLLTESDVGIVGRGEPEVTPSFWSVATWDKDSAIGTSKGNNYDKIPKRECLGHKWEFRIET